ncbi:MAG: Na(+)/H(+) antiporter subunit D [Planctomycetota bacterium]
MMASLPPGLILVLGAFVLPFLKGRVLQSALLLLPALSFWHLLQYWGDGCSMGLELFGAQLELVRVDRLSLVWGYVFHIAAFLGALFALQVKSRLEHTAALSYAGAAIAAVFAGDLVTLFVYWELTAVTSVFLLWAPGGEKRLRCGMRYLIIQVMSGVLLLAGAVLQYQSTGDLAFERMELGSPASWCIFFSFGIKAAFPLLHNWLQDAYPQASPSGTVFLSAFTTKLAIYALARGFAGTDCLIWIGATMTVFPIFFAVIENDLRRVLAYSLNNQLGFMVVGIGIGTELSLNGTAAHAFAHILYKSLLFMSMGAVLTRTGTTKASELGGLYKSMPLTALFCVIGAMSISAFPLFSGFVSKSLILSAAGEGGLMLTYIVLIFASAGVVDHSGIKVPFFSFFAHDQGWKVKEAPWNMLVAMGIAAFICLLLGIAPGLLYRILPYEVDYAPYTMAHVISQLELLLFAALAFWVLVKIKVYPAELRSTNLDFDWTYRKLGPALVGRARKFIAEIHAAVLDIVFGLLHGGHTLVLRLCGPGGFFSRTWATSGSVLWIAIVLAAFLVIYLAA